MHSIFQSANYLPQQMWLYIYYIFVATISTTFMLKSKLKRFPTILLSLVILYISLIPQHFDSTPAWATQASMLSLIFCDFFLYKDRKHIRLISSVISIAIIFLTDYLSYLIVVVLFNSTENYLTEPYVYIISSMIVISFLLLTRCYGINFTVKILKFFTKTTLCFFFCF